jgi:uncharacterized protein (TIGR02147 family)
VREELRSRQKRRAQYSLRAFARDLEISPSFLCEFLAGRQGLSKARAIWIADKIKLTEEQKEHFLDLIQAHFGINQAQKKAADFRAKHRAKNISSHLRLERFHLIAEWYHFVLLEILTLPGEPRPLEEISAILDVPVEDLEAAISRLKNLDLITTQETNGRVIYQPVEENTTVGEDTPDQAVRLMHQQTLAFHSHAVENKPYSERENVTVTFAICQEQWPELRKAMQKAVFDAVAVFANAPKAKDQVVNLTMQMITLLPPPPTESQ